MTEIDHVIYINLDYRTDRRGEIEDVLVKYDLFEKSERFSAIKTNPGCNGCILSHLEALKIAKAKCYKNVLILEDDFLPIVDVNKFNKLISNFIKTMDNKYDVLLLHHHDTTVKKTEFDDIYKIIKSYSTCAYLVNGSYIDNLISIYDIGSKMLIKTGMHWLYACDTCVHPLQLNDKWYQLRDIFVIQRPSIADCGSEPVYRDYTPSSYKVNIIE